MLKLLRKLVFINLSIESGFNGVNHGIAYLVSVVKKHSYNVSCLDLRHEISDEEFRKEIDNLNPSIVAYRKLPLYFTDSWRSGFNCRP
jgi:hypothetical protein